MDVSDNSMMDVVGVANDTSHTFDDEAFVLGGRTREKSTIIDTKPKRNVNGSVTCV